MRAPRRRKGCGAWALPQLPDKLVFVVTVRAAPCLPLWGRWQPEGLTEEVFGVPFCEKAKQME